MLLSLLNCLLFNILPSGIEYQNKTKTDDNKNNGNWPKILENVWKQATFLDTLGFSTTLQCCRVARNPAHTFHTES